MPKKRGPKTDVLEALLKRVDGLEKRLVSEGKSDDPAEADVSQDPAADSAAVDAASQHSRSPHDMPASSHGLAANHANQLMSPIEPRYLLLPLPAKSGPDLFFANTNQHTNPNPRSGPASGHLFYQNTWETLLHPGRDYHQAAVTGQSTARPSCLRYLCCQRPVCRTPPSLPAVGVVN